MKCLFLEKKTRKVKNKSPIDAALVKTLALVKEVVKQMI